MPRAGGVTGAYDPESHEALCGGDGTCNAPLPNELGNYIGAQMAAVNLDAGQIPTATATPIVTPIASPTPTPTPGMCVGDCSGDRAVDVNEIIILVDIALGTAQPSACVAGIPQDASVDVAMIIRAVNNALGACPGAQRTRFQLRGASASECHVCCKPELGAAVLSSTCFVAPRPRHHALDGLS